MNKDFNFLEVGKMLGTSNLKIIDFLVDKKLLFRRGSKLLPYQKFIDKKYFFVHPYRVQNKYGNQFTVPIIKITQEGFDYISKLYKQHDFVNLEEKVNETMFSNLAKLGIKYNKFSILTEINPNKDVTLHQYLDGYFIPLVKYNREKNIIINKYGLQ